MQGPQARRWPNRSGVSHRRGLPLSASIARDGVESGPAGPTAVVLVRCLGSSRSPVNWDGAACIGMPMRLWRGQPNTRVSRLWLSTIRFPSEGDRRSTWNLGKPIALGPVGAVPALRVQAYNESEHGRSRRVLRQA